MATENRNDYVPILFNHNPSRVIGKYDPETCEISIMDDHEITEDQFFSIGLSGEVLECEWREINSKPVRFIKKFRLLTLSIGG
jgi:hypothetical protein